MIDKIEDAKMKTCFFCRGPVVTKAVDYMARHGEKYILIKNLPARVCDQCGEVYLDADSSRRVDKALRQTSKAKDHLQIPVISR
jgi:YgiT-type zinc finger domain-containing protein